MPTESPAPILAVGSIALDAVKTPTDSVSDVLGGSASFFTLAASRFAPVRLIAVIGDDLPAPYLRLFEERTIDLTGLQRRPGQTFRWSAEYSGPQLEHRQTLRTDLNVFAEFHPHLPESVRQSRFVFLGNIHPSLQHEVLDQATGAEFIACDTISLWIETDSAGLERLYRRVHCVMLADEEALQFTGRSSLKAAVADLLKLGMRSLVIKRGEYGSMLFTQEGAFAAPARLVDELKDPTGAGDAFAGGFMGALARTGRTDDQALRQAMLYGNVMGTLAVTDFSVYGIVGVTLQELDTMAAELRGMVSLDGTWRP
jgi:sugar/nucleoside kinase (ribokinase family)